MSGRSISRRFAPCFHAPRFHGVGSSKRATGSDLQFNKSNQQIKFQEEETMNSRPLMSRWLSTTVIILAAMGLTSGFSTLAAAQTQSAPPMIANDDALFVDGMTFKVTPGKPKDDGASRINTSDAQELPQGMIIFRSGEKLYLVDAPPRPGAGMDRAQVNNIRITYEPPKN